MIRLPRPPIEGEAFRAYRYERITAWTLNTGIALIEGGFIGVVLDKLYAAHPLVLALVTAAPMFGNLSSFAWAQLSNGRRKVPFIVGLQAATIALVASVALLPEGPAGAWLLVAIQVVARLVFAGIVTVRSTVWRLNYADPIRGRVTGRLAVMVTLSLTLASLAASWVMDRSPDAFRWIYVVGAAISSIGVIAFSRVPVIGEADQLALEREPPESDDDASDTEQPGMWAVLRSDSLYARYMSWQFIAGVAAMMSEPPLIYLVSRELGASYLESIGTTTIIPFGLAVLTMPLWAAYLDRVHVAEFRTRQSSLWVIAQFLTWMGAVRGSILWVAIGRLVLGLARGGGMLAWQLGHNDFSTARMVAVYMGIHVTLTGVRGLVAPFLGMALYVGFSGAALGGAFAPLAWSGIGVHVFLLSAVLSAIAGLGFGALHREIKRGPR